MELHHSKHHAAYVTGANNALAQLAEAREKGDFANINRLSKDLAFHLGGHTNHSIFWKNLSPDGGDKPEGELAAAIDDAFGSFDAFRAQFTAAALGLQGSGWGVPGLRAHRRQPGHRAALRPAGQRALGTTPLLMLDMWEHAFYLDYVNVKADYVKAFWNIVNWADVASASPPPARTRRDSSPSKWVTRLVHNVCNKLHIRPLLGPELWTDRPLGLRGQSRLT